MRWDETAHATPHGQMAFFIEFLTVSRLFDQWAADGPLAYTSPNGSRPRGVLGSGLLSILLGIGAMPRGMHWAPTASISACWE